MVSLPYEQVSCFPRKIQVIQGDSLLHSREFSSTQKCPTEKAALTFCLLCRQLVQLKVMRIRFFRIWSPETPLEYM
jgi:hypothetical protein